MPRSKLEKYLKILEVLASRPSKLDTISRKVGMKSKILESYLDFLITHGLVKERSNKERTVYAITDIGLAVLKTLQGQKYFEKLKKILRIQENVQILLKYA
jgi:predicted transcriptional regulator